MSSDALSTHLLGAVGVLLNTAVSVSPLRNILSYRKAGNLGGLDSQYWPWFFLSQLIWVFYSTLIGDVWLFLSVWMPCSMWLFFCFTAIRLLSQEEGETVSKASRSTSFPTLLSNSAGSLNKSMQSFRQQRILAVDRIASYGVLLLNLLAFVFLAPKLEGYAIMTEKMKQTVLSAISGLSTLSLMLIQSRRLCMMFKKRDTSSLFIPMVCCLWLNCTVWAAYGFAKLDYSIFVPNTTGILIFTTQLLMKLLIRPADPGADQAMSPVAHAEGSAAIPVYEDYLNWQRQYYSDRLSLDTFLEHSAVLRTGPSARQAELKDLEAQLPGQVLQLTAEETSS